MNGIKLTDRQLRALLPVGTKLVRVSAWWAKRSATPLNSALIVTRLTSIDIELSEEPLGDDSRACIIPWPVKHGFTTERTLDGFDLILDTSRKVSYRIVA